MICGRGKSRANPPQKIGLETSARSTDFVCVLGPSWESLWGPFGYKFVILHVEMDVGIEKTKSERFL